jgi:hypothetical protein
MDTNVLAEARRSVSSRKRWRKQKANYHGQHTQLDVRADEMAAAVIHTQTLT